MLRIAVRVAAEGSDRVLAELLDLVPAGLEQVDGDGWVEFVAYGEAGDLPDVAELERVAGSRLISSDTGHVEDDWADRWRQFHEPLVVEGRLRVRPPWEGAGPEPLDIVIDPGRAFGTGAHPTTSLCLELLLDLEDHSGTMLDLGCGSGVLAILGSRLGFNPVVAADNDPLAVDATAANAEVNGSELEVVLLDLAVDPIPRHDVLVANILAPVLIDLVPVLSRFDGREAILSGILDEQCTEVADAWRGLGLELSERRSRDGWSALRLSRTAG